MIKKNHIYFVLMLLVAFMLANRDESATPDTAAYRQIYEQSIEGVNVEYFYVSLNKFFYEHGVSFKLFLIIITLILFVSWYKITIQVTNKILIAFISFIPFYGLYFYGITLRAAIAVTISYWAIIILLKLNSKIKYIIYYLLITLASGFHITALIFFILPVLSQKKYKTSILYQFLIIIAIIPFFNSAIPFILQISYKYLEIIEVGRLENYLERSSENLNFSLTSLKNILFGGVFILLRSKILNKEKFFNFFLNTYLIGCFLSAIFSFVIAGSRLAMLFMFFEFILITLLYESPKINKSHANLFVFVTFIINFIAIIQKGNGLIW